MSSTSRKKIIYILCLLIIAAAGYFIYIGVHRKATTGYISQFPQAAISADISSGRIEEICRDIKKDRSQEEEVLRSAKKQTVKAITDLDNDAVAAAWNARIGEYRQRKNKNIVSGDEIN